MESFNDDVNESDADLDMSLNCPPDRFAALGDSAIWSRQVTSRLDKQFVVVCRSCLVKAVRGRKRPNPT